MPDINKQGRSQDSPWFDERVPRPTLWWRRRHCCCCCCTNPCPRPPFRPFPPQSQAKRLVSAPSTQRPFSIARAPSARLHACACGACLGFAHLRT